MQADSAYTHVCPNCLAPAAPDAEECSHCDAMFSESAAWRPRPKSDFSSAQLRAAEQHRAAYPRRVRVAAPAPVAAGPARELHFPVLAVLAIGLFLLPVLMFWLALRTNSNNGELLAWGSVVAMAFGWPVATVLALVAAVLHVRRRSRDLRSQR